MPTAPTNGGENIRIAGQATSPGLAFVCRNRLVAPSESRRVIERHEVAEELGRIQRAIETVQNDLRICAERIQADAGPRLAEIFAAHQAMLEDVSLHHEIRSEVEGDLISATEALTRVFRRWEGKFRAISNEIHRERADDLADLKGRLLREIAGVKTTMLERMPYNRVLVAHRLLPSETVALRSRAVTGIVLEFCGPGSHAALLARALGIPTVAQVQDATKKIANGQNLIVDGFTGEVILRPDTALCAHYEGRVRLARAGRSDVTGISSEPARTADGVEIAVMANIASREGVIASVENGADGVGLYRIEQFYLSRRTPPLAAELLLHLREMFAPFVGKPITVRLADLGADKPLPFVETPSEDNPFLGRRGVRLLLQYPDLLDGQFNALLKFSLERDVRILVPLVTLAEEMARLRTRLHALAGKACVAKIPPLGAMIETPAAALTVGDICKESDFLSVGTNDLTQYTMVAGRENPLVNNYYRERHPAVLRLLRMIIEEAGATPVSVCGELAAHLDTLSVLLNLGIRRLSVAPLLVPAVKEAIRHCSLRQT